MLTFAADRDMPVINLVDTVIKHAVEHAASDIHFEPNEQKLMVRVRIDGMLYDIHSICP